MTTSGETELEQEVTEALQRAVKAKAGLSTDEELEALWECAELLASVTGVPMPEEKEDEDG